MDKEELIDRIYKGRMQFEAILRKFDDRQMVEPKLLGEWSIKDMLAHLEFWDRWAVSLFNTLEKGEEVKDLLQGSSIDDFNRQLFMRNHQRDLDDVKKGEMEAFNELVHRVETASPEDLFNGNRFAWTDGRPIANWFIWNSYEHWEEHMASLQSLLIAQTMDSPVLARAREFIFREGRDIEQARYDFHFSKKISLEELMNVLARYQNQDGGFFGLEVDIKAPQSNPFAVELALIVMKWAGTPLDHPVLVKTVDYLEKTQQEDGTWRFTPEIYQRELAPWFQGWKWPNLNPSCPLGGLLKQLGTGSDQLHRRVQALFNNQARYLDLADSQFYDVKAYADYFQTEWDFPQAEFYRMGVVWWMLRQNTVSTDLDATHWMQFAPSPDLAIAMRLPTEALHAQLDRMLLEQSEDGGWPTPYNASWRGWITIQNLLELHAYGRI
jgi:hypothetical protein